MKEFLENIDRVHTTEMGVERIRKNLSLDIDDVVGYCKEKIMKPEAIIIRQGKNWYAYVDGCVLTINAYSYTIITAHLEK